MARGDLPPQPVWAGEAVDLISDLPSAADLVSALAVQAEVLNNLGELLRQSSARHRAREHHADALAIARDIGAPLDEARALEGIGQCDIQDGNRADGTEYLRQALAIYQRIGVPGIHRIREYLRDHGP